MADPPLSDLGIGRAADLLPIEEIAASVGIAEEHLEPYGRYIAKVAPSATAALSHRAHAKYVVVTAVTPTPLGEGKTTTSIGLADGLALLGTGRCSRCGSPRLARRSASRAPAGEGSRAAMSGGWTRSPPGCS